MAAPTTPSNAFASVGFFQVAIDVITILSNMALPDHGDASITTAISGETARTIVNTLTRQRDLY